VPADRWRTPDAGDDDPAGATSDARREIPRDLRVHHAEAPADDQPLDRARREIPRDLRVPHLPEDLAGDRPRVGEDGSWEWKGRRLEPADNTLAERGLERRREVEPAITRDMRSIEAGLPDSLLEGCPEHTLKGTDRFKEKLAKRMEDEPDELPGVLERDIHDGIRFTFTIDDDGYTAGVHQVHDRLTEQGYELDKQDNYWDKPSYKGINSQWVEPHTGELIEVQFHTPTSWSAKQTTHDAYEEIQDPTTEPSRVEHLSAWQREVVAAIPTPPGASDIPNYRKDQR
jgi:hypothetical protein